MILKGLKKAIYFLATVLLIFNQLLAPSLVLAQEAIPSASPEQTIEPSPSSSQTPIPPIEFSPTPIQSEPTPSPDLSPMPSVSLTPVPTIEPSATPASTPTSNPEVIPSPSAESPVGQPNAPPSVSASATPSLPDETVHGTLSATIVHNLSTTSISDLDLGLVNQTNSTTLTTDKQDYSPTDTVLISGTGFKPNTTYTLIITSTDPPPVNFETQITTDNSGSFTYIYQLDGNYRPNYKVEVKDSTGTVVATTTFTDAIAIKLYTDAAHTASNEDYQFALGDTIYANTTGLNTSHGYKFDVKDLSGSIIGGTTSSCLTGSTTLSNSYVTTAVSDSRSWTYELHEWNSNTCGGAEAGGSPKTAAFNVASATVYSSSSLSSQQSNFTAGTAAYVVVNGIQPSVNNLSTTWILPSGATACANTAGNDQPESDANGRLPSVAPLYLQYPPADAANNWNKPGNYETSPCPALATSNVGQWKLKLINDTTHFVTVSVFSEVNTPPSFDAISNQVVNEDVSTQNVSITNVSPGANESDQTVNLSATSSDTSIIPNPSVSGSGANRTLSYTPVANANGSATITVTADDGQAQNNTSSRTFTITVNAVNDTPTITVISPNGGQTWAGGSSHDITWSASDVDSGQTLHIDLGYTTDGGASSTIFATDLPNSGTYSWTVPAINSSTVKIRALAIDDAVPSAAGVDLSDANFTIVLGSISGMKFKDVDGNGSKDSGDSGLSGWTINLSGDSSATATTDSSGNYSFTNLIPGTYHVCETPQGGWTQTAPASGYDCGDGTTGYEIILSAGENVTGQNFGNFNYGQISGKKYEDVNENGEDDSGEPGLAGWTIYIDANNNGQYDFWENEPSVTTDSNGSYTFSNLGPGTYIIREEVQDGWKQTDPTSADSSIGGQNGGSYVVTMTSNGNKSQRNFGNFHLGTISGYKFDDINGDGVWNGEDFGLEDWTIFLDANDNGILDEGEVSTTTDMDGYYEFSGLEAGTYKVREVPAGWLQTTDNPSDVVVTSGTSASNIDFGNFQKITISGHKFEDRDASGENNEGDMGLAGWTIYIDANGNGTLDEGERVATTADDGSYSFDNLGPGTYKIREVQQNGWVQTTSNPADIVTQSGNAVSDINFGNFKKVIITGYKWKDLDADGVLDKDESGIGGWNMSLSKVTTTTTSTTNPDGGAPIMTEIVSLSLVSTLPTDTNGQVNFEVSQPGTYRLTEESQDNFQKTFPADSFFDISVDFSGQTTEGQTSITQDKNGNPLKFGNAPFQQLGGAKFVPTSGDASSSASLVVLGSSTINVNVTGGTSSVKLPDGVVITRSDGGTIDSSLLSAQDVSTSSLSGLGSGVAVDGALQWGIPNLGLEFSQAITLNIFVGTSFNGQTLNVVRSSSGTSSWTSDGIVAPATCVVATGICTFQATKASYYATTHTTTTSSTSSTSDGGGGGGGGTSAAGAPSCGDPNPGSAPTLTSVATGANTVTLTWSKAADPVTYYLITYGLGPGLQQYGNPSVGGKDTTSYTVSGLSGGTSYYFKVRAGNGCAPGPFSNELSAAPAGGVLAGPATGFAPGVLGVTSEQGKVGAGQETGQVQGQTIPVAKTQILLEMVIHLFNSVVSWIGSLFHKI